jgi:hypothetical protein
MDISQALVLFKKYMPPPLPWGIYVLNETSACIDDGL